MTNENVALIKARTAEVVAVVCEGEGLQMWEIKLASREHKYAHPRQTAMALARELTGQSFPQIGRFFDFDHTTAIYACRKVARLERADREYAHKLATYRQRIREIVLARGGYVPPEPSLAEEVAEANDLLCAGDSSAWRPSPPRIPGPRESRMSPRRIARAIDEAAWLGLGGLEEAA